MKGRLIIAIVSTTLEEVALAVGVVWGLPRLGIHIPFWILISVMVSWVIFTVTTYRMGSRALRRKPVHGLTAMLGSEGRVVSPLIPEGMVRIRGELWKAKSLSGRIDSGEKIAVIGQDGLKLTVRKLKPSILAETE